MNIGFVVNNLSNSEQNYELLKLISSMNDKSNKAVPYIFFQNMFPPVGEPNCLAMNILGLSNFQGKLVAFGIDSAQTVAQNNSPTENWIFLWDIPWLTTPVNYAACIDLLNKFNILVRSESHKAILENFIPNKKVTVVKDMEDLVQCLT